MKFSALLKLSIMSSLLHSAMFAEVSPITISESEHFGTASFGVTDPGLWYEISTESYPLTTLLSHSRNKGTASGDVYLSPTGFTIGEAGDYYVSITAVLQNPTEDSTVLIPAFLALDDTFDEEDPSLIGGIVTLPSGALNTLSANGIIRDVVPGTRLSIIATNAGYPFPIPVTVASWSINVHKIN
jgi:hypothetical protein